MKPDRNIPNLDASILSYLSEYEASERDALLETWHTAGEKCASVQTDPVRKAEIRDTLLRAIKQEQDRRPIFARLRPVRRTIWFREFAVAAVVAILIATSFILTPTVHTIRIPVGESEAVDVNLPDGSTIALAAGSRISYTDDFGDMERRITLRGEAFLHVLKDRVPFIIDTYNARTSVIGTEFTIRSWPNEIEASTEVRVVRGLVSLSSRRNELRSVMVPPGYEAIVPGSTNKPAERVVVNAERSLSWISGGFAYDSEPVGNVLADLERRYEVDLKAPPSIRLRRISYWKRSTASVDEVLEDISSTIGVRFRAISGGYELFLP